MIFTFIPLTHRIPSNCAFTSQHPNPEAAQKEGASSTAGLGLLNGGVLVVNPSAAIYDSIISRLQIPALTAKYDFPDQSLLADLFSARWVALPYIYNALKPMRWEGVHRAIWRDEEVKNVHYIMSPKPWQESLEEKVRPDNKSSDYELLSWWWKADDERLKREKEMGIVDEI